MLLDPESLDLVPGAEQCSRPSRRRVRRASPPELFESLVEFHTGVCADVPQAAAELRSSRATRSRPPGAGPAARLGRHAPVQPVRAPAHHDRDRYRS